MAEYTYGYLLSLLEDTSKLTEIDGIQIEGNSILEEERSKCIKGLEDIISENMSTMGINYIRQYEHFYKDSK